MGEPNKNRQHNKPQSHTPPPINSGDGETNPSIQEAEDSHNHTKKTSQNPPVYKRIFTFFQNKTDSTSKIANWISLGMLIVTGILAWYTGQLFHQTLAQTKNAEKSANAAVTYDSIAKIELDSQRSAKKQTDIADANKLGRDTLFINKQKQGIDSQISAIKQTQRQFEISHSPYIIIGGFGINQADSLVIKIQNQGTQVAYLVEAEYSVKAEKIEDAFKKHKTTYEWFKWLKIPKNIPFNAQCVIAPQSEYSMFKTLKSVADTDRQFITMRKKVLFIRVVIYYINTTTNKYWKYDYISGWNPVDNFQNAVFFGYKPIKKYPE